MRNWIKDKWIILTGASSGIGRELCKLLICRYGAKVVGIGRNEEKMQSLISALGENAKYFTYRLFDVSEIIAWGEFKEWLFAQNIVPVLLINNAGMFPRFAKTLDTDATIAEHIIRTNYLSIVNSVTTIAPILKGEGKDKPAIVNVASSAALCAVAGTAVYSASKGAVKGYTEALLLEEKGKKYVGIVYPGTTATDLFAGDENTKNSALDKIAMPAEKMANAIARAILRKKKRAVLGWDAKLMNFTAKLMPVKGLALIAWVMKKSKSKVFQNVFDYE